jgi:Fe-S cluster assembly iron-binding protein IscA
MPYDKRLRADGSCLSFERGEGGNPIYQRLRRRRAVLALTDHAKEVIKGIVEEVGPDGGLRITAAGEANGDTALEFDLAQAPIEGDEVVDEDGAKIFMDEAAAAVLSDKTLDVEEHGDHFHFSLGEQDGEA